MQRFQKFEVDSYTYSNLRKVQIKNGTQIKEQYIGSRKKLFSQNYLIATTANNAQLELNGLSHQKFNSFLGLFSKNLYSQFHKNEKLFDLIAKKQYQKLNILLHQLKGFRKLFPYAYLSQHGCKISSDAS
jgi:hypothetical protein